MLPYRSDEVAGKQVYVTVIEESKQMNEELAKKVFPSPHAISYSKSSLSIAM